jgi:hypothetical protein
MFSDTFAGIAPTSAPGFVASQLIGAMAAMALHRALGYPNPGHPNIVESSGANADEAVTDAEGRHVAKLP